LVAYSSPIPHWSGGENEMATREMIDLVCDEKIVEKDYMPLPSDSMSAQDWKRDAGDFLLNLSDEDLAELRLKLFKLLWWDKYMMQGADTARMVDLAGSVTDFSARVASLLLKSLAASNITMEMLEVDK